MDEEHQACLAQLSRYLQSLGRPHILGKGLFKVDFAATSAKTWNPFCHYRLHEMIPTPTLRQQFWPKKHIVLVVCVSSARIAAGGLESGSFRAGGSGRRDSMF